MMMRRRCSNAVDDDKDMDVVDEEYVGIYHSSSLQLACCYEEQFVTFQTPPHLFLTENPATRGSVCNTM